MSTDQHATSQLHVQHERAKLVTRQASLDDVETWNSDRRSALKGIAALGLAGVGIDWANAAALTDSHNAQPSAPGGATGVVNVRDYGATGDGVTNDTAAFQAALAVSKVVFVPPGDYILSPSFEITRGTHIFGATARGNTAADYPAFPASRLLFTGNANSGFYSTNGPALLTHGSLRNLAIQTTSNATIKYIIDFRGTLAWTFQNLAIQNTWVDGGGVRSRALSSNPITWLNRAVNLYVRVDEASTRYALDFDWADSNLIGCTFSGGRGSVWRGHGHMNITGCQFYLSHWAGLLLRREVSSAGKISITGCSFDLNAPYGIMVNANIPTGGSAYGLMITGCGFRNPGASFDILFADHPTQVIRGVVVACNVFTDGVTPWKINSTNWEAVFGLNYSNVPGF